MGVAYEDVLRARDATSECPYIRRTPLAYSQVFSEMTGSEVYLKQEYLQRTGSFKVRGAYYKVRTLPEGERGRGVVAASAGNHAQGVALAASEEGIPCTVVMPKTASPAKVAATRGYGARVVLDGGHYEEAWARARAIAGETGATIVHAFDDPAVIAAQGVVGLEIIEDLPDADEVYVPVGGGGLAAGVLAAVRGARPGARVVGVQSESFPSMRASIEAGRATDAAGPRTIADGIAVRRPGELTLEALRGGIDDVVTVGDDEIVRAMFLLMERSKAVVEPAGAASLAYLLARRPSPGKKVAAVLAGGNVDMYLLGQIVDKGLTQMGRLRRVLVLLPDRPGALRDVVEEVTSSNANIVEVVHDRLGGGVSAGSAGVTLSLEVQGPGDADALAGRLRGRGIRFEMLT